MAKAFAFAVSVFSIVLAFNVLAPSRADAISIYQEEIQAAQAQVDSATTQLETIKAEYSQIEQETVAVEENVRLAQAARDKSLVELYKASEHTSSILAMFLECNSIEDVEYILGKYYSNVASVYANLFAEKSAELSGVAERKQEIQQRLDAAQAEVEAAGSRLASAEQARAEKEEKLARITAAQTNADLARTFCSLAYSRQVRHDPVTDANPGTAMYKKTYNAIWASKGDAKWPAGKVQGRSCDRGVATAVVLSGFDDEFPRSCGDAHWGQWAYMNSSPRWENLGVWSGNEADLEPGDILIRITGSTPKAKSDHVCMYVGNDIIMEVYENVLKGTDADVGEPDEKAAWVSSSYSNGLSGGNRGRAPGMGKDGDTAMHVFRCVDPQHSSTYAHALD